MVLTISKDQAKDFALACFDEIMREIKADLSNGKEEEKQIVNPQTTNTLTKMEVIKK
jgi:hypothetical protein